MKRMRWLVAVAGCVFPLATSLIATRHAALGDEPKIAGKTTSWPMFGGTPAHNMVNTIDKNIPTTWNVEEGKRQNIKWVAELGTIAYGGPVVADGKVFVGTNKMGKQAILMAFNEADGKFLWRIAHDIPNDPVFHLALAQGLCSTPVVEDKRVYYVTPGCEVICADTAGKIQWSYDMMKELKVVPFHLSNCSPLIVGDLVMVATSNGIDEDGKVISPKAPSFIAVNKKTGKLVWQSNLPGADIIEGQWSNPTSATVNGQKQVIFPGGDAVLYSFEPESGKLIWQCDCNPTRVKKAPTNYFIGTPVVVGDRLYIGMGVGPELGTTTKFSYFLCLDITKKGDVSLKSYEAKAAVNKDSALVWAYGGLVQPPPKGRERQVMFGSTLSTPAVHDGLVYIPEERGYLHCLDAKTGQRYWEHDFKTSIWGSAYYVDGKVYIGNDDGDIFIFVHGKKRQWYVDGKIRVPDGSKDDSKPSATMEEADVRSTPVVVNGVLYIATKTKLYAIANGK